MSNPVLILLNTFLFHRIVFIRSSPFSVIYIGLVAFPISLS